MNHYYGGDYSGHSQAIRLRLHLDCAVWAFGPCHSCGCHWLRQRLCQRLCQRLYLPPGPPGHPPKPVVAAPRGLVSGPFGRFSRGTASEICRLWVPATEVAVAAVGVGSGSALANDSLTDTRSSSSSSLEMM